MTTSDMPQPIDPTTIIGLAKRTEAAAQLIDPTVIDHAHLDAVDNLADLLADLREAIGHAISTLEYHLFGIDSFGETY
jgi:hypothetical protein